MKIRTASFSIIAFALLMAFFFSSAYAQQGGSGIIVGETAIAPGDPMQVIFSEFGAPEHIAPIRGKGAKNGKSGKKNDYVQLHYVEEGLYFNLRGDDNTIHAIMVESPRKIKNVPFSVGMKYDQVKAAWGEPDKKEAGYANYIKKGIVFKVSDSGEIELIAIFKPGTTEATSTPQHGSAT